MTCRGGRVSALRSWLRVVDGKRLEWLACVTKTVGWEPQWLLYKDRVLGRRCLV